MYEPNSVEFMGILVDRQYAPSQKYVQLVFETAEGIRLSLSRNITMVRSLRLGLTYRVKGTEQAVGQKRFVSEPVATLVSPNKSPSFLKRHKIFISAVMSAVVITGCAGVWVYAANGSHSQPATEHRAATSVRTTKTPVTATNPAQSQPAPTMPSSGATHASVKPAASSQKTTSHVSTPSSSPLPTASTPPVATSPASIDQSTVTIPTDSTTPTQSTDQGSGTPNTPAQTPADQPASNSTSP